MISDLLSIDTILLSFESALKIEYDERDTDKIISAAIKRLENAYKVHIDKSLYDLQAESMLVADNVNMLLLQVLECLKSLSLYIDVAMYKNAIGISLADVSYLGLSAPALTTSLQYLMFNKTYATRESIIKPLTSAVSHIDMNTIKRLFIVLLVLERLGVEEGVSVVSRFLYLGGIVS